MTVNTVCLHKRTAPCKRPATCGESVHIALTVNGRTVEADIPVDLTLLDFLRENLGLTGTKRGCGEGDCGACTVLVDGQGVTACVMLAVQACGRDVFTVEGLAQGGRLHPIQEAFLEVGAVQCGFCTPGMLLMAKQLLDANPNPTREEIVAQLAGNLCRCTGYTKIVDAVALAARKMRVLS
ncbi:(2Fe-2S)-binding protein [Solidesulfovibrio alcoholivorans]|uniref:(2Fe-2S)-binding protein n=1 Tax=Solidesulfovibrio alcoholivorans TaxID=81406 RepID=UPI000A03CBB3|nr:(2Fe-2S)-binding protein [Solidesulfovibrio alcoholivorans]